MPFFHLRRDINFFQATALGLGALIGAGIFVLIGPAIELTGTNVIWVYLLAGVSAFLSALTYAELGSTYLNSVGGYGYAKQIVNDRFGFVTGWLLVTGSTAACAVYGIGFAELLRAFVDWPVQWVALGVTLLVCLVNIAGVKRTAKLEYYFTLILMVGLLGFGVFLMFQSEAANFQWNWSPDMALNTLQGVSLVYISFFGFQVIAASSQETMDPRNNIPKAILWSITIAVLVYLFIALGLVGVTGGKFDGNPALLLESTAHEVLGRNGAMMISILGILATLTSLNATFLAVSRRIYSIAKDRYVPELLARVHPKFQTPHVALIFMFLVVSGLIVFGNLARAAELSSFSYLLSLIFIHLVFFKFFCFIYWFCMDYWWIGAFLDFTSTRNGTQES